MKYYKIIYIIGIILVLAASCNQGKKADPDTGISTIEDSGEVIYIRGSATCTRGMEKLDLKEGDEILPDDIISVDIDSFCEIQFGDISIARLEENTTIKAASLIIREDNTDISLGLITGTILCKVEKLTHKESFDIETQTMTCGVRGTEFMVIEDKTGSSLSVKTGKVALVPGGQEINEMKRSIRESDLDESEELLTLIETMEESAEIVEENQEIVLKKEDVVKIKEKTAAMKTLLKEAKELKKIPSTKLEKLKTMIKETDSEIKKIKKTKMIKAAMSKKNREKLKKTLKLKLRDLRKRKKKEIENDEETDGKILVKIICIPADALIYINDELMGKGKYVDNFDHNSTLEIRAEKQGFLTEELTAEVKKGMDVITIRLKKETVISGSKTPKPESKEKQGNNDEMDVDIEAEEDNDDN